MQAKEQQKNKKCAELYLRNHEYEIYQQAITRNYLSIDEYASSYLLDLWHKATNVQGLPFVVLIKSPESGTATVLLDDKVVYRGEMLTAKQEVECLLS